MAKNENVHNETSEIEEVFSLEEFNDLGKAAEREKIITVAGLGGKKLKIRSLTNEEHEKINESAIIKEDRVTRLNYSVIKFESLVHGIIAPNFDDAKFLDSKKCMTARSYFEQYFPPGVVDTIYSEISKLSGFNFSMDDLIESAKN
jgi:hypothetical protein